MLVLLRTGPAVTLPLFASWLHHEPAGFLWAIESTSLDLSYPIWKVEEVKRIISYRAVLVM